MNTSSTPAGGAATTHKTEAARHEWHTGPWAHPAAPRTTRRERRQMWVLTFACIALGSLSVGISASEYGEAIRAAIGIN